MVTIHSIAPLMTVAALLCAPGSVRAQAPTVRLGAAATPVQSTEPSVSTDDEPASGESTTDLAKKLQNPIGNLISVPFQSNTNFDVGPAQGHSGDPQHPAGHPDPPELGLEPDHAHHPAADLAALVPARSDGAVRDRPDHFFRLPFAKPAGQRLASGASARSCRSRRPATRRSAPTSGAPARPSSLVVKGPWVFGGLVNNVFSFGGTSGRRRHKIQLC